MKILTKKNVALIFIVALFTTCVQAMASTPQAMQDSARAQSVYVEYGGPSLDNYSINYDTRFTKSNNGWGMRVGAGYLPWGDIQTFSLPIQLNYLFGKRVHFAELGAGYTFYYSNNGSPFSFGNSSRGNNLSFGSLSLSYRYQPLAKGFTARGGISGLFETIGLPWPVPQVSVGYRF